MGWQWNSLSARSSGPKDVYADGRKEYETDNDEGFFIIHNECVDSSGCAAGFICENGRCLQVVGGSSNGEGGGTAGCGDGAAEGTSGLDCGSLGSGNCTKAGCGATGGGGGSTTGEDCCGPRCCRLGIGPSGFMGCFCGDCPPYLPDSSLLDSNLGGGGGLGDLPDGPQPGFHLPRCNKFCEAYRSATGEDGPGCRYNSCDECSYCEEGVCVEKPKTMAPPCNCVNGSCNGTCEKCNKRGVCVDDAENCQQCCQLINFDCAKVLSKDCPYLVNVNHCEPVLSMRTCINVAQDKAIQLCSDLCPDDVNSCEQQCFNTEVVIESNNPAYPIEGAPDPDVFSTSTLINEVIKDLPGGSVKYGIYRLCSVPESIKESCSEIECDCSADCPDCYSCENGRCVENESLPGCGFADDPDWDPGDWVSFYFKPGFSTIENTVRCEVGCTGDGTEIAPACVTKQKVNRKIGTRLNVTQDVLVGGQICSVPIDGSVPFRIAALPQIKSAAGPAPHQMVVKHHPGSSFSKTLYCTNQSKNLCFISSASNGCPCDFGGYWEPSAQRMTPSYSVFSGDSILIRTLDWTRSEALGDIYDGYEVDTYNISAYSGASPYSKIGQYQIGTFGEVCQGYGCTYCNQPGRPCGTRPEDLVQRTST